MLTTGGMSIKWLQLVAAAGQAEAPSQLQQAVPAAAALEQQQPGYMQASHHCAACKLQDIVVLWGDSCSS
jgi:hypothetical protein